LQPSPLPLQAIKARKIRYRISMFQEILKPQEPLLHLSGLLRDYSFSGNNYQFYLPYIADEDFPAPI